VAQCAALSINGAFQMTVKLLKGGLDAPDDDRGDIAVIASAAVAVRFELP